MSHAQFQRATCCDALAAAGPGASTLCEGWTAHDLAAHLWVRENDVVGALGIGAPVLARLTRQRMDEVKRLLSFTELVAALRGGPPRMSVFAVPGVDEAANALEFFVHGVDVRRAGAGLGDPAVQPGWEDLVWRRLGALGRLLFRKAPVGIVLERDDVPDAPTRRLRPGSDTVTLVGPPSELALYGFGRRSVARVRVIAAPATRAQFEALDLGI
ncbi:MAG: TIGR03085 family protein [Micropruina sp.]|nr:MAG: TIGR03085 family protein [Micropruina sp.]